MKQPGRPTIEAEVAAAILRGAPPRLARRLDAEPAAAEQWTWQQHDDRGHWTVDAGSEVVTIEAVARPVAAADAIHCTCLLNPRCFHVLAVVSRLEPAGLGGGTTEDEADEDGDAGYRDGDGEGRDDDVEAPTIEVDDRRRTVAVDAWAAGVQALMAGASATGTVAIGDLLQAAHRARAAGLHRLAAATTRLVGHLRALADDRPEFELGALTDALGEVLRLGHVIAGNGRPVEAADIGTARRTYRPVPATELRGICSEPIVTASGYAGVVTYLIDTRGNLLSLSDVVPGGDERVFSAYGSAVRLGTTSIRHRDLSRIRLAAHHLSVSDDGRLGGGRGVQAAVLGRSQWSDPAVARLWDDDIAAQARQGAQLVFAHGTVAGATRDGIVIATASGPFHVVTPSNHAVLAYRNNLSRLAGATGYEVQLVARPLFSRPRTMAAIAVSFGDSPDVHVPASWAGLVNLGLDRLSGAHLPASEQRHLPLPPQVMAIDLTLPLERRVQRLVLGGWTTLGHAEVRGVEADRHRLARDQLHTAAVLLDALHGAVLTSARDVTGQGARPAPDRVGRAWLAAATYTAAAREATARSAWAGPV